MRRITHHQEWSVVLINQNARIRAADLDRIARSMDRPAKKQPDNKDVQLACSIHTLFFSAKLTLAWNVLSGKHPLHDAPRMARWHRATIPDKSGAICFCSSPKLSYFLLGLKSTSISLVGLFCRAWADGRRITSRLPASSASQPAGIKSNPAAVSFGKTLPFTFTVAAVVVP